jgi:phenol/toluene 2-monooxygenase (NADH) P0/A0
MVQHASPGAAAPAFDPGRRYVRLLHVRTDGFVEFEFAIGEPELAVELILPADAYREFCRHNRVIELAPIRPTPP